MTTTTCWPRLLSGLLLVGTLAACDSNTNPDPDDGPAPPAAPTVTLGATPNAIALGAATTLTWSSTDATACTASGAWAGNRAATGSEASTPTAIGPAAYTLTCTGPGGSGAATTTVMVSDAAPLPTVSITATPAAVTLGSDVTVTWSSTGATACVASGSWTGSRATSGALGLRPDATGDLPYTLTCTGPGGSAAGTATVSVNPVPTVSLSASPSTVTLGQATTLSWSSTNSDVCTASGDWSGRRPESGVEDVIPSAAGSVSYALTCSNTGTATAVATATVAVNAPVDARVTFQGKLTSAGNRSGGPDADGEIAGATIQILTGDREYTGTTDIDGNYSVTAELPTTQTADTTVVLVGRRVLPSGLEIYFLSQLGSFESARVLAGPDGVLTADEEFRVNITPYTTAEVALEQEVLRGPIDAGITGASARSAVKAKAKTRPKPVPLARSAAAENLDTPLDRFVDELRNSIDHQQALAAATTISLVADRGVIPPFGIADTYSLAFFRDVRLFFIEDQQLNNALAYAAALADTLANRDTTRGISVAEVPLQAVTAVVGDVSEEALIGNGGSSFDATQFRFDPAGTGTYSSFDLLSDDMRWTVNAAGVIEVRFTTPPSSTFETSAFNEAGDLVSGICTRSRPEIDIQPISMSGARQRVRTVQECEEGLEGAEFNFDTFTSVLFASLDTLPASTAADFAGRSFAIEVPSQIPLSGFFEPTNLAGDRLQFNADFTGSTFLLGLSFNWAVDDDGNLQVAYSNGASSVLRVLRPLFDGANLVLMSNTVDSGTYTVARPMFETNDALRFTSESVVGTHYQHGVGAVPALELVDRARPATLAEASLLKGFAIELFPSGTANMLLDRLVTDGSGRVVRLAPESTDFNTGSVWGLRGDGSLIIERYFTFSGNDPSFCTLGTSNPDCYLSDTREVFPIFLLGDRQGWLERRIINESFEPGPIIGTPAFLLRTYTQAPNGDFALPRTSRFATVRSTPQTVRPPLRPDVAQRAAQERALKAATARGDRNAARRIEKQQRVLH